MPPKTATKRKRASRKAKPKTKGLEALDCKLEISAEPLSFWERPFTPLPGRRAAPDVPFPSVACNSYKQAFPLRFFLRNCRCARAHEKQRSRQNGRWFRPGVTTRETGKFPAVLPSPWRQLESNGATLQFSRCAGYSEPPRAGAIHSLLQ